MTRRRPGRLGTVLVAAVALAIAALLAPPPAAAHEDPAIAVRLSDVQPALPSGVQMKVLDGGEKSHLVLGNVTATPMFVVDPDGDPFLQVSTDGVFGDVSSPYLYAPTGVVTGATPARLDCCPEGRWMRLTDGTVWSWADPRLDPPLDAAALGSEDRGLSGLAANRPLATWAVGLRYGETEMIARGVLERRELGRVETVADTVPPGVTASVIDARLPQLRLEVPIGTTFEVLGADGRPVLRMTPRGSFARADSPEYVEHRRAIGLAPEAETGWVPIDRPTTVTWADPRLSYVGEPPSGVGEGTFPLGRWRLPVVVNGQPGELAGSHSWEAVLAPLAIQRGSATAADDDAGGPAAYLTGALLTAAVVAAYLLARRRTPAAHDRERTEE